jgi:hypothetical protein
VKKSEITSLFTFWYYWYGGIQRPWNKTVHGKGKKQQFFYFEQIPSAKNNSTAFRKQFYAYVFAVLVDRHKKCTNKKVNIGRRESECDPIQGCIFWELHSVFLAASTEYSHATLQRNNHATLHATEQSHNLATQQSCNLQRNLQRNNYATLQHNNNATF